MAPSRSTPAPPAAADPCSSAGEHDVTALLEAWSRGEEGVEDELFGRIYDELRRLAAIQLRGRPDHTLQPTALVHETYCRLLAQRSWGWRNRQHFYAIASKMMRRILIDHARRAAMAKRGGGAATLPLDESLLPTGVRPAELERLDDALRSLERLDARKTLIVDLRFFVGLDLGEIAEVVGLSTATVTRHWLAAKAWLAAELGAKDGR